MSDNKPVVYSGGISTVGLLGCALVILKLTHTIQISWFWALAALLPLILLVIYVPLIVIAVIDDRRTRKLWEKKWPTTKK